MPSLIDKAMFSSLLSFSLLACAPPPDAGQEILRLLEEQRDAWNRQDLEEFMRGYWNSEQLSFLSGGTRTSGWQSTLERYRRRYQGEGNSMGDLTFSGLGVEMLGPDSAFVRGRWDLRMPDGETPGGLFTLIVKRTPDGWRIAHDHTSNDSP